MSDGLQSPGNAAMFACGWLGEIVNFFCRPELQNLVSKVLSLVKIIIKPLQVAPFKYIFVFDFH